MLCLSHLIKSRCSPKGGEGEQRSLLLLPRSHHVANGRCEPWAIRMTLPARRPTAAAATDWLPLHCTGLVHVSTRLHPLFALLYPLGGDDGCEGHQ